jgi:hypothetical protein
VSRSEVRQSCSSDACNPAPERMSEIGSKPVGCYHDVGFRQLRTRAILPPCRRWANCSHVQCSKLVPLHNGHVVVILVSDADGGRHRTRQLDQIPVMLNRSRLVMPGAIHALLDSSRPEYALSILRHYLI